MIFSAPAASSRVRVVRASMASSPGRTASSHKIRCVASCRGSVPSATRVAASAHCTSSTAISTGARSAACSSASCSSRSSQKRWSGDWLRLRSTAGSTGASSADTSASSSGPSGTTCAAASPVPRKTLRGPAEASPVSAMGVQYARGQFELGRGRAAHALAAFQAAERLARRLPAPHPLARPMRAWLVHTLVRLGETERAEQALAGLGERDRDRGEMRIAAAVLRLARDDPRAAIALLAPVLDGSARVGWRSWLVEAFLLEAIGRDALGDPAAGGALERALDLAGPDGALLWFLLHPVPGLLKRHARQRSTHVALTAEILGLLGANEPAPSSAGPRPLLDPLTDSEIRVLRYLPTHLSAPEIASELSVSTSTVKTHMRNLYAKLGAHWRTEAVESARALGTG